MTELIPQRRNAPYKTFVRRCANARVAIAAQNPFLGCKVFTRIQRQSGEQGRNDVYPSIFVNGSLQVCHHPLDDVVLFHA